jgi:prepilin-type N-terminal cleavage/methylation domain-containing protein
LKYLNFRFWHFECYFKSAIPAGNTVNINAIIISTRLSEVHIVNSQKMKTTRTTGVGGFTLVEIMIVVAIIALLAAIVIPNLMRAGARSQATTCINNLRQLDTAVQQFSVENGKHVGDVVNYPNDLTPYIRLNRNGSIPPCPAKGDYSLNTVGNQPSAYCSLGSTVTPNHVQQ